MRGGMGAWRHWSAALVAVPVIVSVTACGPPTRVAHAYHDDGSLASSERQMRGENQVWIAEGPYRAWHSSGQVEAEGQFVNGEPDGSWTRWYASGQLASRESWKEGVRHGPWRLWYEDGTLRAEGTYRDDRQEGHWTRYHPDGSVESDGTLLAGRREGVWIHRRADGAVDTVLTGLYEDGQKIEDWFVDGVRVLRYPDGTKQEEATWRDCTRDGPSSSWYPDGVKAAEGTYSGGLRTGLWSFWNPDGALDTERSGIYEDGRKVHSP